LTGAARLKGNQVKALNGPATVIGDKLLYHWEIGKVQGIWTESQETCLLMKYKPSEERVGVLRDEITARSFKKRRPGYFNCI